MREKYLNDFSKQVKYSMIYLESKWYIITSKFIIIIEITKIGRNTSTIM
jgi:hypothetical protein